MFIRVLNESLVYFLDTATVFGKRVRQNFFFSEKEITTKKNRDGKSNVIVLVSSGEGFALLFLSIIFGEAVRIFTEHIL